MDENAKELFRLLGFAATEEDLELFRDFNIVRRPFRSEVIERGIREGQAICCPECLMVSWNPNDVREGYCGNCRQYTSSSDWALIKASLGWQPAVALPAVMVDLTEGLNTGE